MRAFSLKSTIVAMAAVVALTAAAVAPAQARGPDDWWAHHRGGGHHMYVGGRGHGFVGRGYYGGGYYGSGYYGGGYYDGGYDDGLPFALGALGLITGAAIAAERPYASVAPGCMVYHRIYRHGRVIGHRWVDVCY